MIDEQKQQSANHLGMASPPVSLDTATIERIVQGVLTQIGTSAAARAGSGGQPVVGPDASRSSRTARIPDRIVTAAILEDLAAGTSGVEVPENAIITPAARDVIKERGLTLSSTSPSQAVRASVGQQNGAAESTASATQPPRHAYIVRHTAELDTVLNDIPAEFHRELLGCPDDAAALAISSICRGDAKQIVIFAEQTHRAACLANRNERIKAAAVEDAAQIRAVKQQLRVNVWCLNPTNRSWFELRNLLKAIVQ